MFRIVQRGGESREIDRGGNPTAVRVHCLEVEAAVGHWNLRRRIREDAIGPRIVQFVVAHFTRRLLAVQRFAEAHFPDADGREDFFLDELPVRLAGDFFDDAAQRAVAEVRVGVACAGIEIERLAEHVTDDGFGAGRGWDSNLSGNELGPDHRVEALVAIPAAGVLEDLTNGDLLEAWVGLLPGLNNRVHSQEVEGSRVELQPACFRQFQDGNGGDWLRKTGDAEQRVLSRGNFLLAIRPAIAARMDELTVLHDGECATGDFVRGHERLHFTVEGF